MKQRIPVSAALTRIAVFGLGLALFFEQAGALRLLHLEDSPEGGMMTPVYWVSLLAPVFYLAALWSASKALVRLNRGDAFGPAMVCGLRDIGWCLLLGSFAAVLVQPSLIHLIGNGFLEMRGVRFSLTVENVTLGLLGLLMLLLARRGRELRTALDEFV